jgi:hypothetical protein
VPPYPRVICSKTYHGYVKPLYSCNIHKYGKVSLINKGFLNTNTAIIWQLMQTARTLEAECEASSVRKHEYRGNGRWVKYWACLGCWISPCYGLFMLGRHFETYELFISLIFQFSFRPRWTADTGARLYYFLYSANILELPVNYSTTQEEELKTLFPSWAKVQCWYNRVSTHNLERLKLVTTL